MDFTGKWSNREHGGLGLVGLLKDQEGQQRSLDMWAQSVSSSRVAIGGARGLP